MPCALQTPHSSPQTRIEKWMLGFKCYWRLWSTCNLCIETKVIWYSAHAARMEWQLLCLLGLKWLLTQHSTMGGHRSLTLLSYMWSIACMLALQCAMSADLYGSLSFNLFRWKCSCGILSEASLTVVGPSSWSKLPNNTSLWLSSIRVWRPVCSNEVSLG